MEFETETIARAVFIINRHSKTALDTRFLYQLKKAALLKLLAEKRAQKVGLQFSKNPKNCYQHSTVLITCQDFLFHLPADKQDLLSLKHLGTQQSIHKKHDFHMSLSRAKFIIQNYTDTQTQTPRKKPTYQSTCPYFN